jgi:hypothetical protein
VSVIGRGELTIVRDALENGSGLALHNLPSLVDASAFHSLVEVGATLQFRETGLVDLEDFSAVEGIGERLEIILNPALPTALAHAFADRFGATPRKVDGNLGDDVPREPCPWIEDDECDEEWSDVDVRAGTALCYEDAADCDHPEPPD